MKYKEKGFAPAIILIIITALGATIAGGILLNKNLNIFSGSTKLKTTESQKKDLEQAKIELSELAEMINLAQGLGDEKLTQQLIEVRKEQIANEAKMILEKNPCDALMIDIEEALKLASDAWLITDEKTGDLLWKWAQEAYRGFVVDAALTVGATFLEQEIDLYSLSYEQRKELYQKTREQFYNRALLAQQAQLFGFEEIHNQIIRGEYIEPVCIQLWDIKIESQFDYGDGFSIEHHWIAGAELKDIPLYKTHPKINLTDMDFMGNKPGYIKVKEMWWSDDSYDAPYYGNISGDIYWNLKIIYNEDTKDFWHDEITISASLDRQKSKPIVSWTDGQTHDFNDIYYYTGLKFEIPALFVWERKSFDHEIDISSDMEKVKAYIQFVPSKRVRVIDLTND